MILKPLLEGIHGSLLAHFEMVGLTGEGNLADLLRRTIHGGSSLLHAMMAAAPRFGQQVTEESSPYGKVDLCWGNKQWFGRSHRVPLALFITWGFPAGNRRPVEIVACEPVRHNFRVAGHPPRIAG
jgi:hypothetical protein